MKNITTIIALILTSFTSSAQCGAFYDGFESGALSAQWQPGTGTYSTAVTTVNPAVGTYSFEQTGNGSFYQGTIGTFAPEQPDYISFRMRTNTTNAANGYVVIGDDNINSDNGIIFCYFNSTSQLRFYGTTGQNFPIVANQWYNIEIQNIDWVARTSDIYLDGTLILTAWPFRSPTALSMNQIHLFNLSSATAMYDEIIIGGQPLTGNETSTICANDSIVVNGTTYNAANPSGTEVFTNVGPNGCDSTVTVSLNVLPELSGTIQDTICSNGSLVVNGTTYDALTPAGTEVFTNVGSFGCDSIVTVNLTVLPEISSTIEDTICYNGSVVINGTTYDAMNPTGTEIYSNVGSFGCDSIVTINLNVLPAIDLTITNVDATLTSNEAGAQYQWLDCDNGNAIIVGETNQSYSPSTTGNYAVAITVGNCSDTSSCELVDFTGLEELTNSEKELIMIIDFMGRQTDFKPNTPLIFIYSDGTRERVMDIKN